MTSKPSSKSWNGRALPPPPLEVIKAERARRAAERDRRNVEANGVAIRARCQSLAGFVKEAWHILEPNTTLVWNWHLDAICAHLEAVTEGRINRLLMNVPPGSSKSLLVSVLWPAWEWGPKGLRSLRYISTSYNDGPVKRDVRKTRDLIMSTWFKGLWPEIVLTRTGETSFANTDTGTREGIPFGSLTSQRGDRLLIDDPHSTETAESDVDRAKTARKFREGAVNRLNDQERSAIVVIMQRLHSDDISGVIQSLGMGYVHLMLPMEFDPKRRCHTPIGFTDPRTYVGELLDPIRFGPAAVASLKRDMGSYAFAGQYQQRPTPREGGLFKRFWFEGKVVGAAPATCIWVRHWDLAASKGDTGARTAGVRMGRDIDGAYFVSSSITAREEGPAVRRLIKGTAEVDGVETQVSLPQDPGQAGKAQAQSFIALLAGFLAHAEPETGDKVTRAGPFAAQCEGGNVYLVRGDWNADFIDELCSFPGGALKDQVDASSGAFTRLTGKPGQGQVHFEMMRREALTVPPPPEPVEITYAVGSVEWMKQQDTLQ